MIKIVFGKIEDKDYFINVDETNKNPFKNPSMQGILRKLHNFGKVGYCMCSKERPKIAIKEYHTHYGLARYPNTAHLHRKDCFYYEINETLSGRASYNRAISDSSVRINIGLNVKSKNKLSEETTVTKVSGRTRSIRGSLRLQGLLHHIWEEQGLNIWSKNFKGKRTLKNVVNRILNYPFLWGGSRSLIMDRTIVMFPYMAEDHLQHNQAVVRDKMKRVLVLGHYNGYNCKEGSGRIRIKMNAFQGNSKKDIQYVNDYLLYADHNLFADFAERFPTANKIFKEKTGGIIMMMSGYIGSQNSNGQHYINITDYTVMPIYGYAYNIPVDSSHELRIAEKLITEKRSFIKPLRYDDEEMVLPDFILTDTRCNTPMEVWGLNTPEYIARKHEKRLIYNEGYEQWWEWNAIDQEDIPNFPSV